jgi:hypothetical protein
MTLIRDIANELLGMFLADARLSGAILLLVVLVGALVASLGTNAFLDGGLLLFGCLAILVAAALRGAR